MEGRRPKGDQPIRNGCRALRGGGTGKSARVNQAPNSSFGAPLAIEGLMAFFMESTFFAVMFFGWEKVGKKAHLTSTWLVALGSNLSALWILIANGWMQHPVGMSFNPDTARNEMVDFWAVALNPNAVSKFLHTVSSGYVLASLFVIGISSWYLLKKRDTQFARRSIIVASSFGLITSLFLLTSGDESAHQVALNQPMKLAAMEGLYEGEKRAGIVAFGLLVDEKEIGDKTNPFHFMFEIPGALSFLGYHDINAFVPGIDDLVYGNEKHNIMSVVDKMAQGKIAIQALTDYKKYKKEGDVLATEKALQDFKANEQYMGYGYLNDPKDAVPNVAISFYSFHTMVGLGSLFLGLFLVSLYYSMTNEMHNKKWLLYAALFTMPLGYVAQEAGWIVAEAGRQPWAIQDMLPVGMAASNISSASVMITFWLFAILFTGLLIAEIKIMLKQIKIGPEGH
jgi:cytochrome d ubiquinol oxidase subunit I